MAQYGLPHRALLAALLTTTLTVSSGVPSSAQQAPTSDVSRRAVIVRIHNVGSAPSTTDSAQVIIYTSGAARVGVGNAESDRCRPRRELPLDQREHPRHHIVSPAHSVDRHHATGLVDREDRLHVEHAGQPRLAPADAPGPEQVVVSVHGDKHTRSLPHPSQLPGDVSPRPSRLRQFGSA